MSEETPDPMVKGQWRQSESLVALRNLLNTGAHLNQVVARRADMSLSEMLTLAHLSMAPIGPAEIARRLSVTTAASSGIVDKLVSRGHVERLPDPSDRRRTQLVLSDSGRRTVVEQLVPMFLEVAALERDFDDAELAVVTRYLAGVQRAFARLVDARPGAWPHPDA